MQLFTMINCNITKREVRRKAHIHVRPNELVSGKGCLMKDISELNKILTTARDQITLKPLNHFVCIIFKSSIILPTSLPQPLTK